MSLVDPLARRAYHRGYQNRRRRRCKAEGRCVDCPRRVTLGKVGKTGHVIVRCARCIARHAKHGTSWQKLARRKGRCVSCPRMKARGDRHWECPACRKARREKRRAKGLRVAA